ncbi:MAG: helix-hairpin-helix domain-containing protein [Thermonemataceae bacterium]
MYIDVAIAPKTEAAMKLLKKGLEKAAKPLKVSKGKALQKAMMEALEAEKREALEKLSKLRSQQDDVIKKYINDAIKKGDREALKKLGLSNNKAKALIKNGVVDSLDDLAKVKGIDVGKLKNAKFFSDEATKRYINEAIKRGDEEALRKLKGIGKGRAKAMIKNGPIDSLKDLKKIKGIKGKVLEQIKSSDIGNKAAKELQEQAAKLTDDIAKVASKEALEVFEKEAAKKAGKRTVRKVASAAAKKLGLKVGAKIAGRILLKFIPFVNIAMILWDIYEIGSLIYKAYKAYNNPNQGGSSGGGDSEEGGETGSEQESAGKEPENTTEGRQAPAQAGISSAAMQKLAEAPAPVRKIWESLTVMGGEATLTDEHLMRFLALIPKNISEQDADKLIEKMKEDPASDPETVFQKLQMSMENLQKEKNAANNKPNVVKPKPKPNEGTEEETTNQVDKAAGGGGKKADSDTRPAVHVEAKDATYNGPSGGERVGSVEVINASWNHTKGNEVTISIAAWHYESDTPVVVHNIPAKVVKRMFMKDDKAVSTRKEANRFQIRYQLYSHGVKFEFPNGVSGTVGVNREVSGSIEL